MTALSRDALDDVLGMTLTDEQWACVSAPMQPFVIVAGAGTGKTSVMAARVLWLVASGLAAEHEVLGLTFTNKAAAELAHRVATLLARWRGAGRVAADPDGGEPTIATYHSFARRLLDEQGLRLGIEPGARLLSAAAVAQLSYRIVCRSQSLVAARHAPSRVAADVLKLDANLAEQAIGTDELRAHDAAAIAEIDQLSRRTKAVEEIRDAARRRMELAELVDQLRAERVRVGGLDFADHMRLCVDLVRSSSELVDTMRGTYRVILLDEYQDTSIAQRVILSTLFGGCAVTAVGDPLQAIYGWRSASVANIAAFGAHFGASGEPRVLSVNRRSGQQILTTANRVAAQLRSQHPEVAPLRLGPPRPGEPRAGQVRAALLGTVAQERAWIADQVAELVGQGRPPEQIAVLTRTNEALAPMRDALVARGVPAAVSGAAALTASPYAAAVLATLRVLADPADNVALVTLLAGPRWRIGPCDLELLGRRAAHLAQERPGFRGFSAADRNGHEPLGQRLVEAVDIEDPVERPSLLEAAADPGPGLTAEAQARLTDFRTELRILHSHVGEALPDLTDRVVQAVGATVEADLASALAGSCDSKAAGAEPDVGLTGLLRLVDGFTDAEGRSGLGAFLAYVDAAEQLGSAEQVDLPLRPGAVQLMTMHQAKGLEFPVVVLPHLSRDVFPGKVGSERWTTQAHVVPSELRDDRHVLPALGGCSAKQLDAFREACRAHDRSGDDRLAYVAITRAEQVLIGSGHWWGPTQKGLRGPSPYLEALREEALASAGQLFLLEDPWVERPAGEQPGDAPRNPMLDLLDEVTWPSREPTEGDPAVRAARAVAALVESGQAQSLADVLAASRSAPSDGRGRAGSDRVTATVAEWDAALSALLARTAEAVAEARVARLPAVLSASAVVDQARDPAAFAERLLRPMPRRRSRAADLGTAFHAWVEARLGVQPLIADDELPGAADEDIGSTEELAALKESFELLPYAARVPVGLEVPFSLALGGRTVRGRIDAVFPAGPHAPAGQRWEVVDWKTSHDPTGDALQLAIYRVAWAQLAGVSVEEVGAAFAYVRTGAVHRPTDLPDAQGLAVILAGGAEPDPLDGVPDGLAGA